MPQTPRQQTSDSQATDIRLPDLLLRVAVGVLLFVAGSWWAPDRIVAEKIVTALAMPTGIVWLLLLVSVLAARRARRADLMLAAALPWTALTLLGNGMVATTIARSLEDPYRDIQPLQSDPFDRIVVLGGATSVGLNGRIQGYSAGDRILLSAQMYHAGLTKRIVCTGQRIVELAPVKTDPADESLAVLVSLGVPEDSIELLEGRNTSEEMQSLSSSVADSGERIGLVTSAWHLRRALRLAARYHLTPEPLPADFITQKPGRLTTGAMVLSCIPQDTALWTSSKVLKEYLGMLVGR